MNAVNESTVTLPAERAGLRMWARRAMAALAILYTASLVIIALLIHFVGESWWVTDVCMYLPSVGFGLPLPFVVVGLVLCRFWRLLLTQVVALWVLLFPLMGLVLPWPTSRDHDAPVLRVLSYNINSGHDGFDKIVEQIDHYQPDVVLLQEIARPQELVDLLKARYATVEISTQFLVASRFPIT